MGWKLGWSFDGWVVAVTMARGAGTLELQLSGDGCIESCTNFRKTHCSIFATRSMHQGTGFMMNDLARMRQRMPDDAASDCRTTLRGECDGRDVTCISIEAYTMTYSGVW